MATARHPLLLFIGAHGMTQNEFSERAGVAVSVVNAIVRNHTSPRTDTVNKLLAFCRTIDPEVTYEALFGEAAA
jgi:transcriptional regulator with XRE-family HTH domain